MRCPSPILKKCCCPSAVCHVHITQRPVGAAPSTSAIVHIAGPREPSEAHILRSCRSSRAKRGAHIAIMPALANQLRRTYHYPVGPSESLAAYCLHAHLMQSYCIHTLSRTYLNRILNCIQNISKTYPKCIQNVIQDFHPVAQTAAQR